jgi:valyl-tRNA synthetase
MKQELDKAYNPAEYEDVTYKKWEDSGYFNPDNLLLDPSAKTYTIVLPPPNITAKLHIGHSAMLAVEDLLIRYHRLLGERTLWLPGTDHAAIATQSVVERKLLKDTGKTRHDLGREKFLTEVDNFVQETQGVILNQTKKMGSSLDWSRLAFTLDDQRRAAVNQLFVEMYQEGVIYRGERVVNWCPRCHSTLADDEVEHKEQSAKLYTFRYEAGFPIAISTTRPETKFGDTAIAVNPKDERYQKFIGQEYQVNFCGQPLKIKIIADRNVESGFGTGALGVTPAHSMVDWQMAQANGLLTVKVIDEDGLIRAGFGAYSGLDVLVARELIVTNLRQAGLLEHEEEITNNLAVCYRCDTAIEPLPSLQWFINVDKKLDRLAGKSIKDKALEAAATRQIEFIPERFNKSYSDWMSNLHDWCISRQIWFGHAIPVWYKNEEVYVGLEAPTDAGWVKDQDTLDTWFSSGMWTFSTLGWPDNFSQGQKSGDLERFHPTQVLETGYEILTLWVSRMIMMSFFALGEIPFEKVYLHGTILDKQGKKMSKSKGNGVDPLEVIARYGADSLRLSLLMGTTPGNDSRYSEERVEAKRNFINKFWNISRFILGVVEERALAVTTKEQPVLRTAADHWIIGELHSLINNTSVRLDNFDFSLAAEDLSEFSRDKLADWYLEIAKIEKNKDEILIYILKNLLILWHPFIPFVTEIIWGSFNGSLLMVEKWPDGARKTDKPVVSDINLLQTIVVAVRNLRSENKIEASKKLAAVIYGHSQASKLEELKELIGGLKTGLSSIEIKVDGEQVKDALSVVVGDVEIYLLVPIDSAQESLRLAKEQAKLKKLIEIQLQKLANQDFIGRAPANIVAAEQAKLANYERELKKITAIITSL